MSLEEKRLLELVSTRAPVKGRHERGDIVCIADVVSTRAPVKGRQRMRLRAL